METDAAIQAISIAGARAAAYGLVASAFRYPDAVSFEAICEPTRWAAWPDALVGADPSVADALAALLRAVRGLRKDGKKTPVQRVERLQAAYHALFGHSVRGQCPPYELEYGRSEIIQRASELADLAGFYAAFGLAVEGEAADRPDSLCVECEFMSVLCNKETYGIGVSDEELLCVVQKAQRDFLRDHLGGWLPAFTRRVQDAAAHEFYTALADFAGTFVGAECRRLDIVPGPELLELRPADAEGETSIDCGDAVLCEPTGGGRMTPLTIHGK